MKDHNLSVKHKKETEQQKINRRSHLQLLINTESRIKNSLSIIEEFSKEHNITLEEIARIIKEKNKHVLVPVSIFKSKLAPLEALIKYFKDILGYKLSKIAKLLARDQTTIWTTYHNSLEKKVDLNLEIADSILKDLELCSEDLVIPLSIFSDRKFSILESLCYYLRETLNLNYRKIGTLIDRDERTVWTVVNRAKKKK